MRPDLVPALAVVAAVGVLGAVVGWAWSRLAPPETVSVLDADGAVVPLIGQSAHRFDQLATFLLLGLGAGVLTGAAVWSLRRWRGPVLLVAAVLGSLLGAFVALRTGLALAGARYDDALVGAAAGATGLRTPVLESGWVVLAQPFGAVLAHAVAVACHAAGDLGRPDRPR